MKTKILLTILLMAACTLAQAQRKTLNFFYIAHDFSTPVETICEILEEEYQHALGYDNHKVVFYLPNEDHPFIVKVNTLDDNRSQFDNLLTELRSRYTHDTYPYVDIQNIVDIFNKNDFASDDLDYVWMRWYINPTFWTMQYNESLFAKLFFILELENYQDKVSIELWHSEDDGLRVSRRYPFGMKNLTGDWQLDILSF